MMLAASKQLDFPLDGYTNIHHPLQKLIKDKIIELSEFSNPLKRLMDALFLFGRFLLKILHLHFLNFTMIKSIIFKNCVYEKSLYNWRH